MLKEINNVVFCETDNNHILFEEMFNNYIFEYGQISIADVKNLISLFVGRDIDNISYTDIEYGYTEPITNGMFKRIGKLALQLNLPDPKKI